MTTTDEARVTDEDVRWADEVVDGARRGNFLRWINGGILLLADRLAARDAEIAKLRAERAEAVALLERLHRRALNPMRSWDAGRVVDAQVVEDECEDMLAKLRTP